MLGKNIQTVTAAQPIPTTKNTTIRIAVSVSFRLRSGGLKGWNRGKSLESTSCWLWWVGVELFCVGSEGSGMLV